MRLQRLELNGFKSFPDRSELRFDEGVTAIVGPNGCGKSNVVDAITWVLGEQSAKTLRGDRMEDVIFGGSDARKPTAAAEVRLRLTGVTSAVAHGRGKGNNGNGHSAGATAGEAELVSGEARSVSPDSSVVSAAVDDAEPSGARDVELGRRLYRSGESEYLLDGDVCRLRDIQDLLMDAGLGVKAYAVIEQGKIGQILSARPADRRQLIEEAAGVTKYKTRRRTAELKLDAAQQNLTRVDDIIFELDKQRGALKRQAARARRYERLRDEMRRWEKVLFARRYRHLAEAIEAVCARLAEARAREHVAGARVAELEGSQERMRIELAEAESAATAAREAAHARELEAGRRQQQLVFDRQQAADLAAGLEQMNADLRALEARRAPADEEIERRRTAATAVHRERHEAAATLARSEAECAAGRRGIEGLDADVEAARSEVFAAVNAVTTLRHALDHADAASARLADTLAKLDVEAADLETELGRVRTERDTAAGAVSQALQELEAARLARANHESELATARIEHEWRSREIRQREHELAGATARLASLEELDAARAGYADAARLVLAESNGDVRPLGSIADYIEADRPFERAVEAALYDLLQHVVVAGYGHAAAGLQFVRERHAGRCGFLVVGEAGTSTAPEPEVATTVGASQGPGHPLVPLTSVVRVSGPARPAIARSLERIWIAESFEQGVAHAGQVGDVIVTREGDIFRGPHVVLGGTPEEARGILATKREIKELRAQTGVAREEVDRLSEELATLETQIAQADTAVSALVTEWHRQEKLLVGLELHVSKADEETERLQRRQELLAVERRHALEEQASLDARHVEAMASIARIEADQRVADEGFTEAQRRLFKARESVEGFADRAAEAKAVLAALVERAAALDNEVSRLEEAAADLTARLVVSRDELTRMGTRRDTLLTAIAESERQLDADVRSFDELRATMREADERVSGLRDRQEGYQGLIRETRRSLEELRGEVGALDVDRVAAEGTLTHLAATCSEAFQLTLDEVASKIDRLDRAGELRLEGSLAAETDDVAPDEEDAAGLDDQAVSSPPLGVAEAEVRVASVEEAIARLKDKIQRLGPVNMMAIEQFDELETRYTFLTTQRADLVDSIAQTSDAIKRIDRTTRERFREAFDAINGHFQHTFSTLFGGGHAGLMLLDEGDLLETGIDIVVRPPGKRLQNVTLLSGGEKALTAMALMFAIFRYRPSPFGLLDEIDAPLDDANVGRFVEMLRSMQCETQFILITHNRKTMEIANRLYGVTMEEPGVSKLISVQLS